MDIRRVSDAVAVSPQIEVDDVAKVKQAGFSVIVNNRPDGEADDQPTGSEIEAAAAEAGLAYFSIPMVPGAITHEMIDELNAVLDRADGPVFAFCRSGTRSVTLWALSQAGTVATDEIIEAASRNGYDLNPMRPTMETLAKSTVGG